jgi:hypothetical protein
MYESIAGGADDLDALSLMVLEAARTTLDRDRMGKAVIASSTPYYLLSPLLPLPLTDTGEGGIVRRRLKIFVFGLLLAFPLVFKATTSESGF